MSHRVCNVRPQLLILVLLALGSASPGPAQSRAATAADPGLPADVSRARWNEIRAAIETRPYEVRELDGTHAKATLAASNPAQGFETRFDARGPELVPLRPERGARPWSLRIRTKRWGRPGALVPVVASAPAHGDHRVEYRRGALTEWFDNGPAGLEHGFEIPTSPAGPGESVVIDLALETDLRPLLRSDGAAVDFFSAGPVAVLRYGALAVTDARGEAVPARFSPIIAGVRIEIDDRGAAYPLSVDPLATWPAWEQAGTGEAGYSVSGAGDVNGDGYSDIIVGSPSQYVDQGRAYVILGSASGPVQSYALSKYGGTGDLLGSTVATAGDVNGDGYSDVVIGSRGYGSNAGRIDLYLGSASGPSSTPASTITGDDTDYYLGSAVASAGDVNGDGYSDLIVGSYGHRAGLGMGKGVGRVYVFYGSPSGLTSGWQADGDDVCNFGWSVGSAGDVNGDGYSDVIIGAPRHRAGGAIGAARGRVYVYLGSPSGLAATPAWTQSGDEDGAELGHAVAGVGDVDGDGFTEVLVGADKHDAGAGAGANRGMVYLYLGSDIGLNQSPAWTMAGDENGAQLGYSVAGAGDVDADGNADLLVGANLHDASGSAGADRGQAYLYLGGLWGPSNVADWVGSGGSSSEWFGWCVQTAGDVDGDGRSDVIVGGPGYASAGGHAQLFLGSSDGVEINSQWYAWGDEDSAEAGWAVGSAGDVDGDGYPDVIVGAPYHDGGRPGSDTGRATVYSGAPYGIGWAPSWTGTGIDDSEYFGAAVSGAGDVNGDGYADVVVGAYASGAGSPGSLRGRVYLYLGSRAGLGAQPAAMFGGDEDYGFFGWSVRGAGDINGDGYADVVVGAYAHDAGAGSGADRGQAYLLLGCPAGLGAPVAFATGDENGEYVGWSVAGAGDVNGDGYDDVLVGAPGAAGAAHGMVELYLGSPSGLLSAWSVYGDEAGAWFGISVAGAGDVDGDGLADMVVGAYGHDGGGGAGADRGRAYVYRGSRSVLSPSPYWTASGNDPSAWFGVAVAGAGDVNGDGYADIVVGAYGHSGGGGTLRGQAYVFYGWPTGMPTFPAWIGTGSEDAAYFGYAVAGTGDVNGDGYGDIIVGAFGDDDGAGAGADRGVAPVYFGGGGPGAPLLVRQMRSDLSAPIAPGGRATELGFRVSLRLATPWGRTRARIRWQAVPLGIGFNPFWYPIRTGAWYDTFTGAGIHSEPVALPDEGPYVWRARIEWSPGAWPFQTLSRWLSQPSNGMLETDLRATAGPPPPVCLLPDEAVLISSVTVNALGMPVITIQDPNQPSAVTGYNVYRAGVPQGPFVIVATDVADMDQAMPDVQWVDQNGASGGPYYYRVNAYNHVCAAEGP